MLLFAIVLSARLANVDFAGGYIEKYFEMFPSQATAAGRHDQDGRLEDFSPARLNGWLELNRRSSRDLEATLASGHLASEERLDAEALLAETHRQIEEFGVLRRHETDPLFWSEVAANAHVFLLVRDDRPFEERMRLLDSRAAGLPRLAEQGRVALGSAPKSEIAPDLASIASGQLRATAEFYREGLPALCTRLDGSEKARCLDVASRAAAALGEFSGFLADLGSKATGSPRLGKRYAELFRVTTGIETPLEEILAAARRDLAAKRVEAAAYGRAVWPQIFPGELAPDDDVALLRRLFDRIGADHASSIDEFVEDYRRQVENLNRFVHERNILTLPDPLTLFTDRSPAYFVGQSVGGVYPAGPFAPDEKTLWYLPTPPDSATAAEREAFFRDFNHHFNVMITPHEIMPGHYVQLKWAARHPHRVRALFPDGVYVEGWGTFCERLLLDLGWGGPLDRLAHLKKQLENIARAIVDIRVHTGGMTRGEVIEFVRNQALQDEQFARNMWTRSITSPPQITTYYLGYSQVWSLYEDVRRARGDAFDMKAFLDGMMSLGPVPVRNYREMFLGDASAAPSVSN